MKHSTMNTLKKMSSTRSWRLASIPWTSGLSARTTSKAGNPTTPTPEISRRILEKVQGLSKPFGTTIAIENGVGVIRVTPASTQ